MTPIQEQRFLNLPYKRLWQAATYNPRSTQNDAFNNQAAFVHLAKGECLYPADFVNLITPWNLNGDWKATELFSRMVDVVPEPIADYIASTHRVSTLYRQILEGTVNTNGSKTPDQGDTSYERAHAFLYTDRVITDHTGKEITLHFPTPLVQTNEKNKLIYMQALADYRTAYLNYDLTDLQQQREWMANAPLLELAIDQAYKRWRREGATQVEQAQAVLELANNKKSKAALNITQKNLVQNALQMLDNFTFEAVNNTGSIDADTPWYLSYALPINWATPSDNRSFSYLKVESSSPIEDEELKFNNLRGGQSWSEGLWYIRDLSASNPAVCHHHLEADEIELSAKIRVIQIYRLHYSFIITHWSQVKLVSKLSRGL